MDIKEDFPPAPSLKRKRTGASDTLRAKACISLEDIHDDSFIQECISNLFILEPKLLLKHLIYCGSLPADFEQRIENIYIKDHQQELFLDYLKSLQ